MVLRTASVVAWWPLVVACSGDGSGSGPVSNCEAEGVCTGASATTPGTCTAAAADGAACNAATGPGCLIPARCVAGTCQYSGAQSCH